MKNAKCTATQVRDAAVSSAERGLGIGLFLAFSHGQLFVELKMRSAIFGVGGDAEFDRFVGRG